MLEQKFSSIDCVFLLPSPVSLKRIGSLEFFIFVFFLIIKIIYLNLGSSLLTLRCLYTACENIIWDSEASESQIA